MDSLRKEDKMPVTKVSFVLEVRLYKYYIKLYTAAYCNILTKSMYYFACITVYKPFIFITAISRDEVSVHATLTLFKPFITTVENVDCKLLLLVDISVK